EKQYGFNPGVASSGAVLTLNSELLDTNSAYRPGDDIHYQVTLKNELDLPYLFGLLDVDLPVAVQGDIPPQTFALAPQNTVTTTDQVTVDPAITESQVVSLTNRAGALAIDLDAEIAGRTLWMHLNENTGSQTFLDSSLNGHDGSCAGASCPDLGYTGYQGLGPGFLGSDFIDITGTAQDMGFVNDSYTIQAWVYSIGATGYRALLGTQDGSAGFSVGLRDGHPVFGMDPSLESGATLIPFRWQRVTWRVDRESLNYAIFVDGQQVLDQTGFNFGYGALEGDGLRIGASGATDYFGGQIDELSVFPFALSDEAIRDSIGNHSALVFYNGFEVSPLPEWTPIVDDSEYRNNIEVAIAESHPSDYYFLAPLTGVDGFVGEAYLFGSGDEYSDVLEVASSPNLDLSRGAGAFTISTWLNKLPDEGGWIMGNYDLASSGDGESGYPALWVGANTVTVQFGLSPNVCTLTSSGDGVLNAEDAYVTWHHVAATFDGATLTIYLDNTIPARRTAPARSPATSIPSSSAAATTRGTARASRAAWTSCASTPTRWTRTRSPTCTGTRRRLWNCGSTTRRRAILQRPRAGTASRHVQRSNLPDRRRPGPRQPGDPAGRRGRCRGAGRHRDAGPQRAQLHRIQPGSTSTHWTANRCWALSVRTRRNCSCWASSRTCLHPDGWHDPVGQHSGFDGIVEPPGVAQPVRAIDGPQPPGNLPERQPGAQ
ncbi:MAG: LamG domain-containing protein, partial [Anaerolineae bacterium]|nr:LamG domain-containing protein [Anaerolineae bacterium]